REHQKDSPRPNGVSHRPHMVWAHAREAMQRAYPRTHSEVGRGNAPKRRLHKGFRVHPTVRRSAASAAGHTCGADAMAGPPRLEPAAVTSLTYLGKRKQMLRSHDHRRDVASVTLPS